MIVICRGKLNPPNTSFVLSNSDADYETLPLPALPSLPPPNQPQDNSNHIYSTPNIYDYRNNLQTTSFNPDADVLPKLGEIKSSDSRYVILEPSHLDASTSKSEDFYDKVYDTTIIKAEDVEEVYDHTQVIKEVQEKEDIVILPQESCDSPFEDIDIEKWNLSEEKEDVTQ